jgi:hypothetical protein
MVLLTESLPAAGLGKGFVAAYLLRPNHTVFAAVRDHLSLPRSLSFLFQSETAVL